MDHHESPDSAASHAATPHSPSHGSDAQRLLLGVIAGVVAGLALVVGLMVAMRPAPLPALTDESLAAARAKWESQGPKSYDLELVIRGREPGKVVAEVRNGEVTRLTRDGREPDQRRTWQYWSVPAQFDTLDEELADVHKAASGFADSKNVQTRLEAQFDPRFGYPAKYRRIVIGNNLSMSWEVTRFKPVEAAGEHAASSAAPHETSASPEAK